MEVHIETIVNTEVTTRIASMAIEMITTTTEGMNIVEREITATKEGLAEAETRVVNEDMVEINALKGEMVETRAVKEGTVETTHPATIMKITARARGEAKRTVNYVEMGIGHQNAQR